MANADGSVIIDTGLDTSGVEMGAKEVEKRVNNLVKSVDRFGAGLQKSAAGYASNIGEILSREYGKSLEGAAAKLRDLANAKIPTEEYKKISAEIEKAEVAMQRLEQRQEKLKAMGADQTSAKWQQTQKDIEDTTSKLEFYKKGLHEAQEFLRYLESEEGKADFHAQGPQGWDEYRDSLANAKKELEENRAEVNKLEAELQKLIDKQEQMRAAGADQGSKAWQSNQYDIEQARQKLEGLYATQEKMEDDGTSHTLGSQTQEYHRLSAEVEHLEAIFSDGTFGQKFMSVMHGIGQAAGTAASGVAHLGGSLLTGVTQAITTVAAQAAQAANQLSVLARDGFERIVSSVSRAAQGLMSFAAQAGRSLLNTSLLSKAVHKLGDSLKSFTSQTNKTTLTSNGLVKSLTSLKRLLITRVKRMFISKIFNEVREGIQKLAKFDSEFNKSMSRIKNSATQLSGNIAATIGNIIKTLEPIITKVLDLLSDVFNRVNQFFAVLSGKSSYIAAKKGTDDYAESVDKATKKQKKLNAELYSFDTLNRQKKKDDDDSGIQYEKRPVDLPKDILEWIERLKKAFQSGNWTGLGKIIAEGLNAALKVADNWINNVFRPWVVKWAKRIGQIINGLVDGINWELLGKTVADGINAVFHALETFLETVDWLKLGQGIGRAVKAWFDNIEWGRIGRVFAEKWNALINVIKGIVTTPGIWQSIGKAIGDFIKSWFETIDFEAIADVIIAILNGIPQTIEAFLAQDPFKGVAKRIYTAINKVIHDVDWVKLAGDLADLFLYCIDQLRQVVAGIDWPTVFESLRNMAVTITDKLIEYISGIDWEYVGAVFALGFNQLIGAINDIVGKPEFWAGLGTKIADFVKGIFEMIDFDAIADMLINLFNGLITALENFILSNPFKGIGPKIADALAKVLTSIDPVALLAAFFLPGLLGAVKGIIAAHPVLTLAVGAILALGPKLGETLKNMTTNIDFAATGKAISDGLINVLNRLADALKSVDWVALGTAILNGLMDMVSNIDFAGIADAIFRLLSVAFGALVGLATPIVNALTQAWENVKSFFQGYIDQFGGNIISGLLEGMLQAIAGIGIWIKDHIFMPFINGFMEVFGIASPSTVMAEMGGYLIQGLLQGITELWHTITDFFSGALDGLKNMFSGAWESVKNTASTAWNGIKTTITGAFDGAKNALTTAATQVQTTLSNAWNSVKSTASTAWNGVKTTVTNAFNGAKTALTQTATQIKTELSTAWNGIKSTASTAWDGIKSTVSTAFESAKTAVTNTANNMKSALTTTFNGIKSDAQTAWNNLSTATSNAFNTVKTNITNAWTNLKTSLGNIQWDNIGRNMVSGLMNGIGGAWQNLVNSVQNLCGNLINRVKGWFGVHSPSTVFAEIGEYLDAGLEKGLGDGEGKLLRRAGEIASAVTDGMTPESPEVDVSADGIVGGMQAILTGLSGIASIFQTIADTLTAMGGLRTPQIAEGTVVPYKTRIEATGPSEGDTDTITSYLLGILSELQTMSRTMRDGNDNGDRVFQFSVDGRNIFEVVVNENNRAIRQTGVSPLR